MNAPNAALAYKVLDHIDAHPEQWDQSLWWRTEPDPRCGTAGCLAGWAVALSGGQIVRRTGEWDIYTAEVADGLGELNGRTVAGAAASLLGIAVKDADQAEDLLLFFHDNTREDLGRIVAEIFGPRPEPAP